MKFDNFGTAETVTTETTPLMVERRPVFHRRRSGGHVVAANAGTGETLWTWRPDEGAPLRSRRRARCIAASRTGPTARDERIVVVTPGFQLVALDAKTGHAGPGLRHTTASSICSSSSIYDVPLDPTGRIGNSSPPVISNDVIVVGPALTPGGRVNIANVKGDIMALRRPHRQEALDVPHDPARRRARLRDVAGRLAAVHRQRRRLGTVLGRPELGYVYLSDRVGDQRRLRRPSSRQQPVLRLARLPRHQDRQDDLVPAARAPRHLGLRHAAASDPASTSRVDGKPMQAVVQLTKQAFAYVFDRTNGRPVWPLDREAGAADRRAEGVDVADAADSRRSRRPSISRASPIDDLIDFTPELRAEAIKAIEDYRIGPIYTPPSVVVAERQSAARSARPASAAARTGQAGAADPETGFVYVGSTTTPGRDRADAEHGSDDADACGHRLHDGRQRCRRFRGCAC